jgi:phosphoribosylanthranilate isomerase
LKVGVFVNATPLQVADKVTRLGLHRVQLHGDELPNAFNTLPAEVLIRAVRIRDRASFAEDAQWTAGLFLYDALVAGYGGGGVVAPWALIAAHARRPFLLAGGLNPDNVADAIRVTRPAGVDVASGVELSPGKKDPGLVAAFIQAARAARAERVASTTP